MLCVIDIDTSHQESAALQLCSLIELVMTQARREVAALPDLYKSGAKYIPQPSAACAFRSPKDVHSRKGGDCKQLVVWRIAELREKARENATPRIIWLADKKGLSAHAQVRRADGTIEDPSLILGMRAP